MNITNTSDMFRMILIDLLHRLEGIAPLLECGNVQ
jgi:hypothetical protein